MRPGFKAVGLLEELLRGDDSGHCVGPAGVERDVGDGLDELVDGGPLSIALFMWNAICSVRLEGDERGDGDEAAVPLGQPRPLPDVSEDHIIGERRSSARNRR